MSRTRALKVYWWNEEPNFGDAMTPLLLSRLFGLEVTWAPMEHADLTAAGSVIQWITPARKDPDNPIHVWGSGYIFPDEPPPAPGTAVYHAVRGPESARLSNLPAGTVFGDPGLLAGQVFERRPARRHTVGVVPHLWHRSDPIVAQLAAENNLRVIDVTERPESVIQAIAACDFIFSTSLHGLVIADSFAIPNLWLQMSPGLFGGRWKFDDYYAAFGLSLAPVPLTAGFDVQHNIEEVTSTYLRPHRADITRRLFDAFPASLAGR
jgi:pyruvyltransferase